MGPARLRLRPMIAVFGPGPGRAGGRTRWPKLHPRVVRCTHAIVLYRRSEGLTPAGSSLTTSVPAAYPAATNAASHHNAPSITCAYLRARVALAFAHACERVARRRRAARMAESFRSNHRLLHGTRHRPVHVEAQRRPLCRLAEPPARHDVPEHARAERRRKVLLRNAVHARRRMEHARHEARGVELRQAEEAMAQHERERVGRGREAWPSATAPLLGHECEPRADLTTAQAAKPVLAPHARTRMPHSVRRP